MRYFIIFVLVFLFNNTSFAQGNLVPNPSFEDTVYCPFQLNQVDACSLWMNWGETPDYYNSCNNGGLNVPNAEFGFQYAHSGKAFIGIVTYALPGPPGGPNYREYIASVLTSPLIIGTKYFISFYVNCAGDIQQVASNKIGVAFTNIQHSITNSPTINNHAQLYTDSIITDSLNWTKISGSFIADSAYSYLMLGNFFDDSHTDTLNLTNYTPYAAYYYIDDICVSTDSIYNEQWTGIESVGYTQSNNILTFPNPLVDVLTISNLPLGLVSIKINDMLGKNYFSQQRKVDNVNCKVDLSFLNDGIYIITFLYSSKTYSKKIIIHHLN